MENKFGKVSRVSICAGKKDGKTILEDVSFTAPYKIMTPFEKENGGIQVMPLCASAGIMSGDLQNFPIRYDRAQIWKYCHSHLKKSIKWMAVRRKEISK